jgi:predicted lactoylglutathione lyase
MIGYVTVGTNNLEKAAKFYDELLAGMGAKRFMESETFIAWATNPEAAGFSITKPFDGNAASVGNGVMVALQLDSSAKVDTLYAKAIKLGGTDEGPPGARSNNFYAGYFRDLDGNKLNFFCMS